MKRGVIGLITAVSLALAVGVAQAHGPGDWGHWSEGGGNQQSSSSVVAVAGVVTSVDPSTSSFAGNAFVPTGEGWHQGEQANGNNDQTGDQNSGDQDSDDQGAGQAVAGGDQNGSQGTGGQSTSQGTGGQSTSQGTGGQGTSTQSGGPQASFRRDWLGHDQASLTPVTITTDGSTTFRIHGQDGTLNALTPGERFVALFNGSPTDSLQTLVSSPAVAVFAHTPPTQHQLYAFVGTVSGVDTTAGTVSVQVSSSLPSGLVTPTSNPATFTVSPSTMILGGSAANGLFGGSLTDVKAGDVVAGGVVGPASESLSQVESSPLQVLVDFPASAMPATTTAMRRTMRQRALTQAMALFGYKVRRASRGHHARHRTSHSHHGHKGTSRTRTHGPRG